MLGRLAHPSKGTLKVISRCNLTKELNQSRFLRPYSQLRSDRRLRILFCGSDDFSIGSLKAVHQYSQEKDSNVASIDVAAKTDKRAGRGLKTIRPPPIKLAAHDLGLKVHQFDTFRGWNLPLTSDGESYINMVIAVSFGLLVPPRILGACQHGGLNVHPSMLPDLKGSAPIEHAILHGYRKTGITVQTLHPSKFDEGKIVMQTPDPGLDIPEPDHVTAQELRGILAPIGAAMLVECLRGSHYLKPKSTSEVEPDNGTLNHAPKLSPLSRRIEFQNMSSTQIFRLNRAMGRLWVNLNAGGKQADSRLVFAQGIEQAHPQYLEGIPEDFLANMSTGLPFSVAAYEERLEDSQRPLLIKTIDSKFLQIPQMTISGTKPGPALASAIRAGLVQEPMKIKGQKLCIFKEVLC